MEDGARRRSSGGSSCDWHGEGPGFKFQVPRFKLGPGSEGEAGEHGVSIGAKKVGGVKNVVHILFSI